MGLVWESGPAAAAGRRGGDDAAAEPARRRRSASIRWRRGGRWPWALGAFMGQLDASVVTLAFPASQRQYGVALAGAARASLAHLLRSSHCWCRWAAGRTGVAASWRTCTGSRRSTAASAGCGLAPTLGVLIAVRVAQAAGAAMLQANSVALVATSAPAGRRRAALGIQAGAQAVGLALGPVAGGLLVASAGWRSIFFINVPVGVVA